MKRKRQRKNTVWKPWPTFLAWCPAARRYDAFTETLVALVGEKGVCEVFDFDDDDSDFFLPPREAAELIRARYEKGGWQKAHIEFAAPSGRELLLCADVYLDRRREPGFALLDVGFWSEPFFEELLLPDKLTRFKHRPSSLAEEAAVAWLIALSDSLDILKRLCTSSPAITVGCCVEGPDWGAPLSAAAATYHADGYPGRDLALSWMYLHNKEPIDLAAGWSIDTLRERVEASPHGSSIWIVDEDRLGREEILKALDLPPKTLVEGLEAAANKLHPSWEPIQWALADYIVKLQNAPDDQKEMTPVTEEHIRFIEDCTPAYVRHLDNGGLVLHAHPDRTLWPLWADALRLLGIRP